jgi:4a-hydroxytetrahydrobiopterin dehydratase
MTKAYDREVVETRLETELPAWDFADDHLVRTYETPGWRLTLMLAQAIGFLAEGAWHHPELVLNYSALTVRLQSHDAGGITERDFALAARIEQLAAWQPDAEEPLPGHPESWIT